MNAQADCPDTIPATGLTVVVPHDNPALDIIFVHGFTGHPERTWRHKRGDAKQSEHDNDETSEPPFKTRRLNPFSNIRRQDDSAYSAVYWPRDLLPTTAPNARVMTYGYDSNIRHWASQPISRNTVRDIAWDFLVALEVWAGLLSKSYCGDLVDANHGRNYLRSVFEATTGIMFFGTPHGGADPRGFLQHVSELVVKAIGYKVNEQIVNALLPSSERLRELRDEFNPMAHEQQWTIHSFQEQLGAKALNGRKVVEDNSSYLNIPDIETTEHIGNDHGHMCRFTGPNDIEYKKVVAALQRMLTKLPEKRSPNLRAPLSIDRKQTLQDSLKFDQIDARHMTIKRAHAKTCKWLKTKEEYLDWLNPSKLPNHHGFLWIKGKPGTGKSTLMKFALAQARRTMKNSIILSFFFNARGEKLEKSTVGMYRSLLLQLLDAIPSLEVIFDSLHLTVWPQEGQMQWSVELLKDLFGQAIQCLGQSRVVCFIDALDECNEDQIRDMVSFFEHTGKLAMTSNIRFEVCFSSRHYPHITITHGLELVLEGQEGHKQDIANYTESELKIGYSKVAGDIKAELQAKASGIFMWVVLVVEILNKEHDRGRINILRKRLREIPTDLHELFRDILTRDTRDREELILPQELYFAVLAGIDPEDLGPWDQDLITLTTIQRYILDCSKGLAEITESKSPVVQFIHESVRDFLLKNNGLSKILPDLGDRFRGQSHDQLKDCCLKYICSDVGKSLGLPEPLPKVSKVEADRRRGLAQQSFPFLEYAVHGVLYYADEAAFEGISQANFLQTFPLKVWINLNNLLEQFVIRYHKEETSLLYILAEGNFARLIKGHFTSSPLEAAKGRHGHPFFAALAAGSGEAVRALAEIELQLPSTPIQSVCQSFLENPQQIPNLGRHFRLSNKVLFECVRRGETDAVQLLLATGKVDSNSRDESDYTPLHYASGSGHLSITKLLVETGVDKHAKATLGWTPLHAAAANGHMDVLELLIEAGVNEEDKDGIRQTPLHDTATERHLNAVWVFLKWGGDKDAGDWTGRTLLQLAAEQGYLDAAKLLIREGANLEAMSLSGETPLHYAVSKGHLDIAKLLIREGAKLEVINSTEWTPLHLAAESGYFDVAKLLITEGADLEVVNLIWRTPLHLASSEGHLDTAKLLIREGANLEAMGVSGETPLHLATSKGHLDTVKLLIGEGANLEVVDLGGRTPLHFAAQSGRLDVIKLLIREGANLGAVNSIRWTPLHLAVESGHWDVVGLLIAEGADTEATDIVGKTPLDYAANLEVVRLLEFSPGRGQTNE